MPPSRSLERNRGALRAGIPLRSRSLGVLFADEMEAVGDQAVDLDAVVVEMSEETLDRGLEGGIGREILVPQHRILQQPPQPLDQVQVGRIGWQINRLDAAALAGQP